MDDIDLDETEDYLTVSRLLGGERDAEEAESLLDALLRISATADRAAMGAVSWAPAVACLAEFSPDESQLVEVALALLAKLALANQKKCDDKGVALILRIMGENGADEPTLQEQCCLLVKGLGEGCAANSQMPGRGARQDPERPQPEVRRRGQGSARGRDQVMARGLRGRRPRPSADMESYVVAASARERGRGARGTVRRAAGVRGRRVRRSGGLAKV